MAFSMHSHSGQFCPSHAQNTLEEMVQRAIELEMTHLALTEHMPRTDPSDLYPEEIQEGVCIHHFLPLHKKYLQEAVRLRAKYANEISLFICFEGEWIRSDYGATIKSLLKDPVVDFFIGSVHHVHTVPIDHNTSLYAKAVQFSGGTEEGLFADYYDLQYEMLVQMRPKIVGHFDLIKLLSTKPLKDPKLLPLVWKKILRNLEFIVGYGGLVEINSSGLRKGLGEPYPGRSICEEVMRLGGKFTLSDDSHCVAHVATNYEKTVEFLEALGLNEVYVFEKETRNLSSKAGSQLTTIPVQLSAVKASLLQKR